MADRNYSEKIANAIKNFLINDDWHFSFDEEKGRFTFGISLKSKLNRVDCKVIVNNYGYTVYGNSPITPEANDKTMMMEMADFLHRANFGLRNGCFELDMNDGELRYKSYVDCENLIPSQAVIENSIVMPARMIDRYAPGILSIIFTGGNARDCIDQIEGNGSGSTVGQ